MNLNFYKYHGTGNDFIMIDLFDNAQSAEIFDQERIARMCHRRFGIGADGLILLKPSDAYDFEMIYFNADGRTSSMCGNGGRCIAKFAKDRGYIDNNARFLAIDGEHVAQVNDGLVELKMNDVNGIVRERDAYVMDTGSPHYIKIYSDIEALKLVEEAHKIRYSNTYRLEGINVNFVERQKEKIKVRTYERGVEDETYSCGTGVVASAIAAHIHDKEIMSPVQVITKGGQLEVSFKETETGFTDIYLTGPAEWLFEGCYKL